MAFPTSWNPSDKSAGITLSSGNLVATTPAATGIDVRALDYGGAAALLYCEVVMTTWASGVAAGFANASYGIGGDTSASPNAITAWGDGNVYMNGPSVGAWAAGTPANGTAVCLAIDTTNKKFWARSGSGNWNNSGTANPATNTGGYAITNAGPYTVIATLIDAGFTNIATLRTAVHAIPSGFTDMMASGAAAADESIKNEDYDAAGVAIDAATLAANFNAVDDRDWAQPLPADLAVDATQATFDGIAFDFQDWLAANENAVQDRSWQQQSFDVAGTVYNDSVAETAATSDAPNAVLVAVGAIAETAAAADSQTGLIVAVPAIAETAATSDAQTGLLVMAGAVAETAATADTTTGGLLIVDSVAETAATSDAPSAVLVAVGAIAETAAAADSQTGLLVAVGAIAETAAAADSQTGLLTIAATVAETAAAADTQSGGLLFAATIAETAATSDTPSAALTIAGAVAETAAASDSPASALVAVGAIAETAAASDASTGLLTVTAAVSETAATTDAQSVPTAQVYNETVAESAATSDTITVTGGQVSAPEGLPFGTGGMPISRKRWKALQKEIRAERKELKRLVALAGDAADAIEAGDEQSSVDPSRGGLLASPAASLPAAEPLASIPDTEAALSAALQQQAAVAAHIAALEAEAIAAFERDEEEALIALLLAA